MIRIVRGHPLGEYSLLEENASTRADVPRPSKCHLSFDRVGALPGCGGGSELGGGKGPATAVVSRPVLVPTLNVTAANTVVNRYSALTTDAVAGATVLTVASTAALNLQ